MRHVFLLQDKPVILFNNFIYNIILIQNDKRSLCGNLHSFSQYSLLLFWWSVFGIFAVIILLSFLFLGLSTFLCRNKDKNKHRKKNYFNGFPKILFKSNASESVILLNENSPHTIAAFLPLPHNSFIVSPF